MVPMSGAGEHLVIADMPQELICSSRPETSGTDEDGVHQLLENGELQQGAEDESNALFDSDEFRMYCYKVLPCAKRAAHEWTTCPWKHPGERAARRDPRVYNYLAIPCPDTKEGKECPRGDDCPNCHSLFEYWLHPSRYRTQLCRNNDGSHCKRQICFFAHSIEELRVPDHSHLNIPEEMKQSSSNADNPTEGSGISTKQPGSARGSQESARSSQDSALSSSHKHRHRHSSGNKLASKASGDAATMSGSACTMRGSFDVPPSPGTPSPNVGLSGASVMRQASGPLMLSLSEQQQGCHLARASSELLRRSMSLDVAVPGTAAHGTSSASGSAMAATSALFSSAMVTDPEVGEPMHSPQTLAAVHSQQRQQREAAVYERNLAQLVMAQQQQQLQHLSQQAAAWPGPRVDGVPAGYNGAHHSPPLSPTSSNVLSSMIPEDAMSTGTYTSLGSSGSYVSAYGGGSSMGAGVTWRPPLPRSLSGPPAYCQQAQGYVSLPTPRLHSLDAANAASAAAAVAASHMPASAADYAAAQAQMNMLHSPQGQALAAAAALGSQGYPVSAMPLASQQLQQPAYGLPQQQGQFVQQQHLKAAGEQLNLADVAELVDSVNRGELGECGSQVLTGVIGLLMQQLQQQQLAG